MDFLNSKFYRALEVAVSFVLLNLVWLLLCFPVITAFPATAALFGVVREWSRDTDSGTFEPFFRHFRANFRQSFGLGLLWILAGAILVADFFLLTDFDTVVKVPLFLLLSLGGICYIFTSVYIFPVMVNFTLSWRDVLKNSLLISISQLGYTIVCVLLLLVILAVVFIVPLTGLIAGSVTAYAVYVLCKRGFDRIEAAQKARK